jgi:DNA-binding NarL/FixJ family response regulator
MAGGARDWRSNAEADQVPDPETLEQRIRVLVVDDHDVVRWGFNVLLNQESWVDRVVTADSGDAALRVVDRFRPHVAVVDLVLGTESGTEICKSIREASSRTRVLLVSGARRLSPHDARAVGASGFVSKQWGTRDIASAIRMVGLGMTVFPPVAKETVGLLSERESEVLNLMAEGATNQEIAVRLFLSPHTIKDHTTAVYRKLKVRNRAEAVVRAQRWGLLA